MRSRRAGFTILELLVVMTVLGILATAAMPLAQLAAKRSKERELRQSLWEIRHAIDRYKEAYDSGRLVKQADASGYPPSLAVLAEGVDDAAAAGQKMYFLRSVPRNPFGAPSAKPEHTWALRSYASPPDRPAAGADVFDVHALSDELAIDGTPYRQW